MKTYKLLLFWMALAVSGGIQAAHAETVWPTWMDKLAKRVDRPTKLSFNEQLECTYRILDSVNHRFHTSFTREDVAPIKMSDWEQPESGFVRGGGFNIRILGNQISPDHKKKLHPGRFASIWDWLTIGLNPSLHIPGDIDGVSVFELDSKTAVPQVDFVAHLDSAFAYLPLGLVFHELVDVVGADIRNPCPKLF